MLRLVVVGEKAMRAATGGAVWCCHSPGSGCDCTVTGNFSSKWEGWLTKMNTDMAEPIK